jgi:hypothetical protein
MNIRRWLPRRGPLIAATLAMVAAVVIAPAPASAATTYIYCYPSVLLGPSLSASGTTVTGDMRISCVGGFAYTTHVNLTLSRDGALVGSNETWGGVSLSASASCVPGNYVMTTWGVVTYPIGNIPASDSFYWQSPSVYINCVARPVVANPGNQVTWIPDSAAVQMTATGGTAPYTWSATGLPTSFSINPSTGLISGRATQAANTTVTVTVVDAAGGRGSTQFTWNVRREPCPRC